MEQTKAHQTFWQTHAPKKTKTTVTLLGRLAVLL